MALVLILVSTAACDGPFQSGNSAHANPAQGDHEGKLLGTFDYNSRDYKGAIEGYTLEIDGGDLTREDKIMALHMRGKSRHALGQYTQAIADFTDVLRQDRSYSEAYLYRGDAYKELKEFGKAIADFDEYIRMFPKETMGFTNRGIAYKKQGKYDRAIEDYSRAIELDPGNSRAHNNRANAYKEKGDYGKAIADYNEAIRLRPHNNPKPYQNRGEAYLATGKYKKAAADFDEVLWVSPERRSANLHRGNAYRGKGDMKKACADWRKAAELSETEVAAMKKVKAIKDPRYENWRKAVASRIKEAESFVKKNC